MRAPRFACAEAYRRTRARASPRIWRSQSQEGIGGGGCAIPSRLAAVLDRSAAPANDVASQKRRGARVCAFTPCIHVSIVLSAGLVPVAGNDFKLADAPRKRRTVGALEADEYHAGPPTAVLFVNVVVGVVRF